MVSYISAGQEQYATLLPAANTWHQIAVQLPRSIAKTAAGALLLPRFADLNGDSAECVMIR